jgi:HK97 family phage prohead protease/HK97 family phage major capsid protein
MPKSELQIRAFPVRADDSDQARTVRGLAVPYGVEIELFDGYFEQVAPSALAPRAQDATSLKLVWRHDEPIGLVTEVSETDAGIEIAARFSDTAAARDAYQLVRDGVIDRLSIGFMPLASDVREEEDGTHTTITSLDLREVSLVPWPAYDTARVTEVRNTHTPKEPMPMPAPQYATPADLDEVRADITDLAQRLALAQAAPAAPAVDARSAGAALKAIVTDPEYRASYDAIVVRAYDGTKSAADSTMPTPEWIGDLTRLIDKPNILKGLFSTGSLPAEGMSIEFTELATNTIAVEEQVGEGDDLKLGKLTTKESTAPIKTFGGYTQLTRQAIERTRINLLDAHLRGMAIAAGQMSAAYFAAQFAAAVKTQDSSKIEVAKDASALVWADLASLFVDAAAQFADQALTLDGLVVDKATFKALTALTGADGRPLLRVAENPANTVGTADARALTGVILDVPIACDLRATPGAMGEKIVGAFYNSAAIRTYETPLAQLQDENVVNLSKSFSVYRYGAVATEIPTGLVPLKLGA